MHISLSKTEVDHVERICARIKRDTGFSVSVSDAIRWIVARHDAQMKIDDAPKPRSRSTLIRTGPAARAIDPELIGHIREWHGGHARRDARRKKDLGIKLPWQTIELRHVVTQVVICEIAVDRDEDDDALAMIIESKVHAYLRPRPNVDRLVEVRVLFNDGTHEHSESYSFLVPIYGRYSYA